MKAKKILVTGAGGFIGHHLVKTLKSGGYWVRGVDLKYPEYEASQADEFELLDLRRSENCLRATAGVEQVYNLAANMGELVLSKIIKPRLFKTMCSSTFTCRRPRKRIIWTKVSLYVVGCKRHDDFIPSCAGR